MKEILSRTKIRNPRKKKFTLLELLAVVSIIAFIAVVIVPKIGGVKDGAKVAGVDTNLRMVNAYVQSVVHNYDASKVTLFEDELKDSFTEEDLVNPFTRGKGIVNRSEMATKKGAIFTDTADNTKASVTSTWEGSPSKRAELAGSVLVAAYPDPSGADNIEVALIPFNKDGKPVLSKKIVVKP